MVTGQSTAVCWRQTMSSWADDADDDNSAPDFSAIPPPPKAGWGKVEAVQPVGLVFEDFEVRLRTLCTARDLRQ